MPARRVFVGRERPLEALRRDLDDAAAGRGRVLLIGGEPGIGKTRLAEEFAQHAARTGALVVWGRSWEAGGAPAYWPWIQALRSLLSNVDLDAVLTDDGVDAPLAQLLPELGSRLPHVSEETSTSPDAARFDLFVAVSRLLQRATEDRASSSSSRTCTPPTRRRCCSCGSSPPAPYEHRLVVLGTYPDNELRKDHPLTATVPELLRAPGASRIRLTGLTEADVARLIETVPHLQPTAELVQSVHRKTDGNPLFVQEYAHLLESEARLTRDGASEAGRSPKGSGRSSAAASSGSPRAVPSCWPWRRSQAAVRGRHAAAGDRADRRGCARGAA